jgi:hypothetical protein
MNSVVNKITQAIEQEIEHGRKINDDFIKAGCLLETHFQKRPSSLLEIFPELQDQTISEEEVLELKQSLIKFIKESPSHANSSTAIKLLALARDPTLKEFFISQLRLNLEWRKAIAVFELLLALENLGEKIFYTSDSKFIGSRSYNDTDTNFPVAKRYLEKC